MGGNQDDSLPCATKHFRVLRICRTKAEVHEVHFMPRTPIECAHQRLDVRCQRLVKYFHREYFGIGGFLANHCCYGRSVA